MVHHMRDQHTLAKTSGNSDVRWFKMRRCNAEPALYVNLIPTYGKKCRSLFVPPYRKRVCCIPCHGEWYGNRTMLEKIWEGRRMVYESNEMKTSSVSWIAHVYGVESVIRIFGVNSLIMAVQDEQHMVIRFCVRLSKMPVETYDLMKQVYDDECLAKRLWNDGIKITLKDVKQWDWLLGEEAKPTVITQVNIDKVATAIDEDHHTSTWSLKAILHIPKSSIHKICTKHLGVRRVSSMWVSHHLTSKQMEWYVNACNRNLQRITQDHTFLSRVITYDENCVHYYDPLTKQESETWQRPDELKAKKIHQDAYDPGLLRCQWHDLSVPLRFANGEGEEKIRHQRVLPTGAKETERAQFLHFTHYPDVALPDRLLSVQMPGYLFSHSVLHCILARCPSGLPSNSHFSPLLSPISSYFACSEMSLFYW